MVQSVEEHDLGFKVLYSPQHGIKYDIVAVHGVGAHPDHTWCKRVEQGSKQVFVNWLADKEMLPAALPNARIIRFGARTEWFGSGVIKQTTSTVADLLLISLRRDRKNNDSQMRPLLFIAHSVGGLIVIKALLTAANSPKDRHLFHSVTGIAFLGTPFRGAEREGQDEMILQARELHHDVDPEILRITDKNNEMLKGLTRGFMQKRKELGCTVQLVCFFELEPSDVMILVGKKSTRPKATRVDETSGCLDGAEHIPLQRNHFNMNKFSGPDEETYRTVEEKIVEMASRSNLKAQYDDRDMHRSIPCGKERRTYSTPRKPDYDTCLDEARTNCSHPGGVPLEQLLWRIARVIPTGRTYEEATSKANREDFFWDVATTVEVKYTARYRSQSPLGSPPGHYMSLPGREESVFMRFTSPGPPSRPPDDEYLRPKSPSKATYESLSGLHGNGVQPSTCVQYFNAKKPTPTKSTAPFKQSAKLKPIGKQEENHILSPTPQSSKRHTPRKRSRSKTPQPSVSMETSKPSGSTGSRRLANSKRRKLG